MDRRFAGKVAIVTGGGGGIGAATTQRLVAEGATVVVADIDLDAARAVADAAGPSAHAVAFDAGDPASVQRMVDDAVAAHGRLDVLHNNAALTGQAGDRDVAEVDFDLWDRIMAVNLRGYVAGCRFAIPHMIASGGGAIVQTSSGSGLAGDLVRTAYGASKAAVISLTQSVATQYGPQGIRCNAIAPGIVLTDAARRNAPQLVELLGRHALTTRLGSAEDIAALVCFLASDEAGYISGQVISCDGGAFAHVPQYADLRAAEASAPAG
jgi:NAD(P)-dependent dehydrogenase (short-subunit alcohol dehydrogenase family)